MVKGLVVGLLVLGFVSAPGCRAGAAPSAASSAAGPRPTPALDGAWVGTLHVGALNLRLVLKIKRAGAGWTATVDSLDQHATDIPVDTVTVDGGKLTLALPNINGSYEARIDGDRLVGTFTQNGAALPLELAKTAKPPGVTARPQEPRGPLPYEQLDVSVENRAAGITLACTLTEPSGKGPFAAVVLATGSGPQNRDEALMGHRPFLVLSDAITRKGVAVLRCDDRGVGKSTGTFAKATTFDFVDDALAEIAALRARAEIAPTHIGLVGHSEGATVAAIAAAKSKDVAFIVLLAGPALPGDQISNLQRAWFERAAGEDGPAIAATKARWDTAYSVIKTEPDDAAATKKLRALYDGLSATDREQLGGPAGFDALARELLSPWWRTWLVLDPRTFLAQVTVPVLALNGERDVQVAPSANLPEMKKALARDRDATIRGMPGLNHLFQPAKTGSPAEYGEIEETMSPAVLTLVSDWIAHHAR